VFPCRFLDSRWPSPVLGVIVTTTIPSISVVLILALGEVHPGRL
jgi:hypothetical protein